MLKIQSIVPSFRLKEKSTQLISNVQTYSRKRYREKLELEFFKNDKSLHCPKSLS